MKIEVTRTLLAAALLTCAFAALGDRPETPPPGMGKYVIVLWSPGTPVPGDPQQRMPDVPEPDVAKLGGRVLDRIANRRVVYLPFAAAKQLQRHEAVASMQRIWVGESLDNWDERDELAGASKLGTDADTDLEWGPKSYSYDGSGNIKKNGTDEYTYDSAGRLIRARVNGKTETYRYDAFGNLAEKTVSGANRVQIAVDPASNRLIGPEYDAAGNVTTRDGRARYTYDSLNMLSHYEGASDRRIVYDAADERIGTIIGSLSRWTIRDLDGQILREYRGDDLGMKLLWFWEQDHVRAEGQLVGGDTRRWGYNRGYTTYAPYARYGGERHYHLDHLGSVRMVTDKEGRSLSEHDYYPFGTTQTKTYQEAINWADPHVDGMRFAGHWRDYLGYTDVEGNDYIDNMHARSYDPAVGRFLSVDPVLGTPEMPQSWNQYAYVMNNPVIYIDPTGESTHTAPDGTVVAVYDDGNLNVYRHGDLSKWDGKSVLSSSGKGITKMGSTMFWDEFRAHDNKTGAVQKDVAEGARIEFGKSFDGAIGALHAQSMEMNRGQIALESMTGGLFDIKNNAGLAPFGPNTGRLLNGQYATARSAGNFLAGYNAAGAGVPVDQYMKMAGSLHLRKWTITMRHEPCWAENTQRTVLHHGMARSNTLAAGISKGTGSSGDENAWRVVDMLCARAVRYRAV